MNGRTIVDRLSPGMVEREPETIAAWIDAALAQAREEAVSVTVDADGYWIHLATDGRHASVNVGRPGPIVSAVLDAIRARRTP